MPWPYILCSFWKQDPPKPTEALRNLGDLSSILFPGPGMFPMLFNPLKGKRRNFKQHMMLQMKTLPALHSLYGGFLKWGYPQNIKTCTILVLKHMVLGIPHLRKPHVANSTLSSLDLHQPSAPFCPATLALSGNLYQWRGPPPSHPLQFAHTTCDLQHGTGRLWKC